MSINSCKSVIRTAKTLLIVIELYLPTSDLFHLNVVDGTHQGPHYQVHTWMCLKGAPSYHTKHIVAGEMIMYYLPYSSVAPPHRKEDINRMAN